MVRRFQPPLDLLRLHSLWRARKELRVRPLPGRKYLRLWQCSRQRPVRKELRMRRDRKTVEREREEPRLSHQQKRLRLAQLQSQMRSAAAPSPFAVDLGPPPSLFRPKQRDLNRTKFCGRKCSNET